jgi:hypothetical protein
LKKAKVTKQSFTVNKGKRKYKTVVSVEYPNKHVAFAVDWFPKVQDNVALANFIKDKIDTATQYGYARGLDAGYKRGFADAKAKYKG